VELCSFPETFWRERAREKKKTNQSFTDNNHHANKSTLFCVKQPTQLLVPLKCMFSTSKCSIIPSTNRYHRLPQWLPDKVTQHRFALHYYFSIHELSGSMQVYKHNAYGWLIGV